MTLKVKLSQFLDQTGNELELTAQAKTVFTFITTIISWVSMNVEQSHVAVDLRCNTRADGLTCEGIIGATVTEYDLITWQCDTCEASGTISKWQGSLWDNKKPTIH